ncbi:hypothetical protein BDV28DRAFT_145536 [Aspergillus coremiiformis]|uniref:Uncharacterized protein n=1 Tax=Aspergillus coremiiformis TaxID=138285 RepID=A0A5N6ZEE2_9EURO|nr:hypothetical protein BDV28DRAFT_145536 [Aspergillus coremiiformis]
MPSSEALKIDATTFVRYVNEENFIVENSTTMETSRIGYQGDRGPDLNVEENKDLTNETASERSILVGNTGTETHLSTPFSDFDGSNITEGNADDHFHSAEGPSTTRASSPRNDHPVAMQRFRASTSRDSGEIIVLPEPGLPVTEQARCAFPMLDESTRDQIELLGYAGVLDSPIRESILLLGVMYREEPKIMGCTVSFFNREEQGALRRELAYYLTKDEWFHIRRYGSYWH